MIRSNMYRLRLLPTSALRRKLRSINSVRYCSNDTEVDPEEEARRAAADELRQNNEKKLKAKQERSRIVKESIEYQKQVSELRKKYAKEHKEKEEKMIIEKEERIRKLQAQKPKYPNHMLPVMEAYPDPSKEEYADMLKEMQELKAQQRAEVYNRLEQQKQKSAAYKLELVDALKEDSLTWFTSEDLKNQAQLQAKVAKRLEDLYPLRSSFEKVLPKNPYKLEHLFQDQFDLPVPDKLEERDVSAVFGYESKDAGTSSETAGGSTSNKPSET